VKAALESAGMLVLSAESTMVSANTVPVDNIDDAKKILRILDALEDNDDIQDVYSNFDMSDDIMQEASA
jgi:transcriptional/translational regulatory protein YebC/TACO1